ncbi:diaminobutyrate acetyltransferase [Okibacterium endophyticum]
MDPTANVPTDVNGSRNPTDERILEPRREHAADMWRLARDSVTLDLNTSYAYLVYCRDFARTSRIALIDGDPAGFVIGHLRPEHPSNLFVWQIAVSERYRGIGLAGRMLDDLVEPFARAAGVTVETTITRDNAASQQLFASFAKRRAHGSMSVTPLFVEGDFPDGHSAEELYEIGPVHTFDGDD